MYETEGRMIYYQNSKITVGHIKLNQSKMWPLLKYKSEANFQCYENIFIKAFIEFLNTRSRIN